MDESPTTPAPMYARAFAQLPPPSPITRHPGLRVPRDPGWRIQGLPELVRGVTQDRPFSLVESTLASLDIDAQVAIAKEILELTGTRGTDASIRYCDQYGLSEKNSDSQETYLSAETQTDDSEDSEETDYSTDCSQETSIPTH